uniref:ORF117 n=1 Tax=Spodoptera frugiperda granulovirus TaxID=307454 RepID=A0A346QW37_9BBAC|nr:ORF117 [Spodoptera frugiperda granulovirus]
MHGLEAVSKKRKHIANIVNIMLMAVKKGAKPSVVRDRFRQEYHANNQHNGASYNCVLSLFDYLNNVVDTFDWRDHIFNNSYQDNMAVLVCGGYDFKDNNSVCVLLRFYSDAKMMYRLCVSCYKLWTTCQKYYEYRQTVPASDLYWFVCTYVCDNCYTNRLYVQC